MDVQIEAKQLQAVVKAVKRVLSKASVDGSAEECLLTATTDKLKFECANQGLFVMLSAPAVVKEPGAVVVRLDYLAQVKLRGDVRLSHTAKSHSLAFESGGIRGELRVSEDADDIEAQRPSSPPALTTTLPTETLRRAVKRTCFASTGLPLKLRVIQQGNVLSMSANDTSRACSVQTTIDQDGECDVVLPAALFVNLLQIIQSEVVYLGFTDRTFRISAADLDIVHPVMQQMHPIARDVWAIGMALRAQTPLASFDVDVATFRELVDSLNSLLPSDSKRCALNLTVAPTGVTVGVKSAIGQGTSKLAADTVGSGSYSIDSRYMLAFLELSAGTVRVNIHDKQILWWSPEQDAVWTIAQLQ